LNAAKRSARIKIENSPSQINMLIACVPLFY
jgi:hypothetical protein